MSPRETRGEGREWSPTSLPLNPPPIFTWELRVKWRCLFQNILFPFEPAKSENMVWRVKEVRERGWGLQHELFGGQGGGLSRKTTPEGS